MWTSPSLTQNSCRSFPFPSSPLPLWPPIALWGLGRVFLQRKGTQLKEGKSTVPGWFSAAEDLAWGTSLELLCLNRSIGSHMVGWGCFCTSEIHRCLIAVCLSNTFDNYYCLQETDAAKSVCQSNQRLLTSWRSFIKKSVSKVETHYPRTWNIPGTCWRVIVINPLPGLILFWDRSGVWYVKYWTQFILLFFKWKLH